MLIVCHSENIGFLMKPLTVEIINKCDRMADILFRWYLVAFYAPFVRLVDSK